MRILMLVPYYAPDLGPSAPLFTMLSEELVRRGHQVSVIAAVPHYPTGSVPERFRKQWIQRSLENDVEVIRVRIPSVKRASMAWRLLQYICYQFGAAWAGIGLKFDVAFVTNPALWVWWPFTLLVFFQRKAAIFSIQDVYPDVGIALGIFHHKLIINVVASLERFCLKHSSGVQIISDSFRPGINALGVPDAKMVLIHNWVDTNFIKPLPKQNDFSEKNHLVDRFVILYAGNIGLSQGLESILVAAKLLAHDPSLLFVFVGDGSGRETLVNQATQAGLSNVLFLPYQSRKKLPEVLSSADISIITLKRDIGSGSLPSKTLSGLASGRPLIVSVDEKNDAWNLVEQAEAGLCVPPDNPAELVKAILTLKKDQALRSWMGQNGRAWAEQYHSPQSAAEQFENLFIKAIAVNNN